MLKRTITLLFGAALTMGLTLSTTACGYDRHHHKHKGGSCCEEQAACCEHMGTSECCQHADAAAAESET